MAVAHPLPATRIATGPDAVQYLDRRRSASV